MALTIKHAFTSPVVDDGVASEVGPSEWNAAHTITGTPDAAGVNKCVLFNDNGVIGGDPGFSYDKTTKGVALNATPKVWISGQTVFEIGPVGHLRGDIGTCEIGSNLYFDGAWKYRVDGAGAITYVTVSNNQPFWRVAFAPVGIADGAATPVQALSVGQLGYLTASGGFAGPNATAALPTYTFSGSNTTGFFAPLNGYVGVSCAGAYTMRFGSVDTLLSPGQKFGWGTAGLGAYSTIIAEDSTGLTITNGGGVYRDLKVQNFWAYGNQSVSGALTVGGVINANGIAQFGCTGAIANGPTGTTLMVQSATGNDAAYMAFHRSGVYAGLFGLDTDNAWRVGGWSMGVNSYRILHEGNSFSWDADQYHLTSGGRNLRVPNLTCTNGMAVGTTLSVTGATALNSTVSVFGTSTFANDMTLHRGNNTALFYMGNAQNCYLYQDGSKYNVPTLPVNIVTGLSINTGRVPITGSYFEARTAINQRLVLSTQTNNCCLGVLNDADSAWGALSFTSYLIPAVDNSSPIGQNGRRWTQIWAVTGTIQTSDLREKMDVRSSPLGLDFINSLNPVAYKRIIERNEVTRVQSGEQAIPEHWDIDGTHHPATTIPSYSDQVTPIAGTQDHYGLIAQDVKQAVTAAGVASFAGFIDPSTTADPDASMGLVYTEFVAPLIKAVQELSAKVATLEAQLAVKP